MTFRVRLLSTYLLLFVVVISTLSFYVYKREAGWHERDAVRSLTAESSRALDLIDNLLERLMAAMASLDRVRAWTDGSSVDQVNNRLLQYCSAFGLFDRMTLYDDKGKIIADSGATDIGRIDPNASWKEGVSGTSGYLIRTERQGGAEALFLHRRVTSSDGRITRVIIGRVQISALGDMLHGLKRYNNPGEPLYDVALIASDGRLLHSTDPRRWGGSEEWAGLKGSADKLWKDGRRQAALSDRDKIRMISIPAHRAGQNIYPWLLRVDAPKAVVLAESNKILREMVVFGLLLGGCSSLGIWILARKLSRPVHEIVKHATLIAKGDFSSLAGLAPRADEFGILIDSFKYMGEQLQHGIAALRSSEQMYRSVIETSPNAITIASLDGQIIMANQQSLSIFGFDRIEDVVGRHLFEWVSPQDQEKAGLLFQRVMNGELLRGVELSLVRSERHSFFGEVSAIRVMLEGEDSDRLIIVSADITDRKRVEQQVLHLNEELEKILSERTAELDFSNRELEGFCYAISHELRAPIARLQGFSEALKEECQQESDGFKLFYAERIDIASRQLRHVIDAILLLSRLSKTELNSEAVNLSELAQSIADACTLSEQPRTLSFIIEPGVMAFCDRQLLNICLENLIGNAVKYSSMKETAVIEFGRHILDGEAAYFVRDNGAGFDMAFVDKLFKPFLRLHNENEFPGTGIGLVTVARIVERHGGRVWAEGVEGKGATFWFTLGESG